MADDGARGIIEGFLALYGLQSLAEWAWNLYLETGDIEQIKLALPQQQAFKDRFPAYDALAQQGRAISPDQYIAYENNLFGSLQQFGVPSGMYDSRDAIANLLLNDVSIPEVNQRLAIAADAAFKAPQEVKDALSERYGVDIGNGLVGYYLDPDRATPYLEQQYAAAQVVGAAKQQQVNVETNVAERLASQGVNYSQAQQGFGTVVKISDLTAAEQGSTGLTQGDLVQGVFGDAAAQKRMEAEARRRSARYQGSEGGAASNQTGVSGLRSANS